MCSPHSPDLSGMAALFAASSSAQNTTTRAGATSCPCLRPCHLIQAAGIEGLQPQCDGSKACSSLCERKTVV